LVGHAKDAARRFHRILGKRAGQRFPPEAQPSATGIGDSCRRRPTSASARRLLSARAARLAGSSRSRHL